jgi:hypothetical protein
MLLAARATVGRAASTRRRSVSKSVIVFVSWLSVARILARRASVS